MAGRGITDLRNPRRGYDPRRSEKFETQAAAKREDRTRARMLREQARLRPQLAHMLLDLADRIDPLSTRAPTTIASSRYMHRHRRKIGGELWRLHGEGRERGCVATLMPAGHLCAPTELGGIEPGQLSAQVRSALFRAGLGGADGFLFVGLHGEYDPLTGRFQLHFHLYGVGGALDAVRRLCQQARYKPQMAANPDRARSPVQIRKAPLTHLPDPLTYLVQSWWPSRRRFNEDGTRVAKPRRERIPEPAHSEYLLWLDRWRLQDIVLMIGLRVINGRLRPRK